MPDCQAPAVRFVVGCPRSGAALLMRIFDESVHCAITSGLVQTQETTNVGRRSVIDHSIFTDPSQHSVARLASQQGKAFLICNEVLIDSRLDIFPSASAYKLVKPVVLIRDPVRIVQSMRRVGWSDRTLTECYTMMCDRIQKADSASVYCCVFERLLTEPEREVKQICEHWGVPFSKEMLTFRKPFASDFLFPSEEEKLAFCQWESLPHLDHIANCNGAVLDLVHRSRLSSEEKSITEAELARPYLSFWAESSNRLRSIIISKSWVAFDLDNTLHNFTRASKRAANEVLNFIAQMQQTPLKELKQRYSEILRYHLGEAMSDGHTTAADQKQRFAALLSHFSLPTDGFLNRITLLYDIVQMDSLEINCGAAALLTTLRQMGKKIAIFTEGPRAVQERVLKKLMLADHVDFLATADDFGASKTNGLFRRALRHLHISPADMIYVGDNLMRDVQPAMKEGIDCLHFDEHGHFSPDSSPPRVNTLQKLLYIVEGQPGGGGGGSGDPGET